MKSHYFLLLVIPLLIGCSFQQEKIYNLSCPAIPACVCNPVLQQIPGPEKIVTQYINVTVKVPDPEILLQYQTMRQAYFECEENLTQIQSMIDIGCSNLLNNCNNTLQDCANRLNNITYYSSTNRWY